MAAKPIPRVQQEFPNPFSSEQLAPFQGIAAITMPIGSTIGSLSQEIIDKAHMIYQLNLASPQPHPKSVRLGIKTIPKNFEVIPGMSLPFTIYIHEGKLFLIQGLIGRGSFAKANFLTSLDTGELFVFHRSNYTRSISKLHNAPGCAITYYTSLYHSTKSDSKKKLSIMRLYNGGDVYRFCEANEPFIKRVTLCLCLSLGVQTIHRKNFVHGDLKEGNAFWNLDYSNRVSGVIGDFDLLTSEGSQWRAGTYRYLAPDPLREIAAGKGPKVKKANDIWALAMVLIAITTKKKSTTKLVKKLQLCAEAICNEKLEKQIDPPEEKVTALLQDFTIARSKLRAHLAKSPQRMLKEVCNPMMAIATERISIDEVVSRITSIYKQLLASQQKKKEGLVRIISS
jgi:serine/threonine protein kinase